MIGLGATYLDFDAAQKKGLQLIRNNENPAFGLLIVAGINLGLRFSDLRLLTYGQLRSGEIEILEQKTRNKKDSRPRKLMVNDNLQTAVKYFDAQTYPDSFHAFRSQKGTVYSNAHVNRLLRKYFTGKNISSHSLRKTFGRRVWESNGQSEGALHYLNEIFSHKTINDTKRYLGIRQEEIDNIYMNL